MDAKILSDAIDTEKRRLEDCNAAGRKLMAQAETALSHMLGDVLGLDDRELMTAAMNMVDALSRLRAAHQQYETLRRRNA